MIISSVSNLPWCCNESVLHIDPFKFRLYLWRMCRTVIDQLFCATVDMVNFHMGQSITLDSK